MRSDKSGSDSLRRKGCARRVRLMRGLRAEKSFISIYKAVFRCREAPGCPDYKCKQSFSELSQVQGLSPVGAAANASNLVGGRGGSGTVPSRRRGIC